MSIYNKKKVTINDVAKKSGVSKATISRYLNGKFSDMSENTRILIQNVIKELNYRPSNIARSLKAQNSKAIGCVIADMVSPFSTYIVKGITDVCKKNEYQVLFVNTDNKPEDEIEGIKTLIDRKVDGMIINTTGYADQYLIHLKELGMPIVLADRSIHERYLIDTITTNNYDVTYECIKFLHDQGYHKVAFFTEKIGNISSRYIRHRSYLDAQGEIYHINVDDYTYLVDPNDIRVCRENLHKFLDQNPDEPVAIFTVNGVTLLNVLQSMQDEGYKLGYNIGVCGFDDWGWAPLISPGITTLTQDSYMAGRKCAELLLNRIEQDDRPAETEYVEMPAKLVVRGSTTINFMK